MVGEAIRESLNGFGARVASFFSFVNSKLARYPMLSIGEKIAYPIVVVGILLLLTSIILFIL